MKIGTPKTPTAAVAPDTPAAGPAKMPVGPERLNVSTMPDALRLQRLGIDAAKVDHGLGKSKILDVFGAAQFAEFGAVNVPGKVVWVNFDLARQMGFDVPPGNKMTEAFHEQLIEALSFRALEDGEDPGDAKTVSMFADKYGGTNIGGNKGAGRAGFLPYGNLNIKGVGITPLAVANPNDFQHSHGGAPMREGLVEAMWGELNLNLFARGSTQILAVIDNGDYTEWPSGGREHRSLIVRAGTQFRPAHLLQGYDSGRANAGEAFVNATRETGELVTRKTESGEEVPDLQATMTNVVRSHARTAAEQLRWRILHGALSTSNMEINGAQLDLATETSQPRSAAIGILDFLGDGGRYGGEHSMRANQLGRVFTGMLGSLDSATKQKWNGKRINADVTLRLAYTQELQVQLLCAAGMKESLARGIQEAQPNLVASYAETLGEMMKLRNAGETNTDKKVITDISVLDVFGMLSTLPKTYFDDPSGDLRPAIREGLAPIISGNEKRKARSQKAASRLIDTFAGQYGQVMAAATQLADGHYDDAAGMRRSLIQRAAFENQPMPLMYRSDLNDQLIGAISQYEKTGDTRVFTEAVDKTVAKSVRNVDGLLGQGNATRLGDGGVEMGARTIDGIDYSVRAWEDGRRRIHVELPVQGSEASGFTLATLDGSPHLWGDQIDKLSYRFSTDGWKTFQEVPAKIEDTDSGKAITFDVPMLRSDVGQLEGTYHCTGRGDFWFKDGSSNFRGYTYAVPDNTELAEISARL